MPTVTLTTDFGDGSAYVAAMKGTLLAVNPAVRLLDLSHRIRPQDLMAAAYFLADALPWFPPKSIHVIVVDPGVGTGRALLCVEWAGQTVLVPDNGCWTPIVQPDSLPPRVYRLEERRYWREDVSSTFHGRDVLAPVAGHLSLGVTPADLGPEVADWVRLTLPQPRLTVDGIRGEVVIVDRFGNLVTNITSAAIEAPGSVRIDGRATAKWVKTYGDAEPGTLVALIGSAGRLEIAIVNGSAAARLCLEKGAPVEFCRSE
jgi:S-adenosylmethionine hydrolase